MNTTPLHEFKIPGFQVVSKHELCDSFSPNQSAYYVLLRRRTTPEEPHEAVLFVHYVDHFLDACQRQIEELWAKHGVPITHIAVKLGAPLRRAHDFAAAYTRALTVQKLRQELQPRFRRL
jgi:hypothetical protein